MTDRTENPTGEEIADAPAWLGRIVDGWRYGERDRSWFMDRLTEIPGSATVAGGFITNLLDLLQDQTARDLLLGELRFATKPSRFKPAPMNHFMLTAVHVAHQLGSSTTLGDDMPTLQPAISRSMAAALIRATLPGYTGMTRIGEILRLVSNAFSGTMFSHLRVEVERRDDHYIARHHNEYNFLAHYHYEQAYMALVGKPYGPAERAEFRWTGPGEATVTVWASSD